MLEKLGSVGAILPAVLLLLGLGLWLLGQKLARPACALSGLVLGGVAGLLVGEALSEQGGLVLPMVIGAAIAGALLAALLFRVWMAASGALIFGLVAASVVLLWQGTESTDEAGSDTIASLLESPEEDSEDDGEITLAIPDELISDAVEKIKEKAMNGELETDGDDPVNNLTIDSETAKKVGTSLIEVLKSLASYYQGELSQWWSQAGTGARGTAAIVGLIAAGIGLLLGLLLPYIAASLQSAIAGSVLILFSSFSLIAQFLPEHLNWLPATPRGVLLCLGLITAIGLVLQLTIFKRKEEK